MTREQKQWNLDRVYQMLQVAAFSKRRGGHYKCALAHAASLVDELLTIRRCYVRRRPVLSSRK